MNIIKSNAWAFLLWSTLAGTISFLFSSLLIDAMMSKYDLMIVELVLSGGIGALLFGILLLNKHMIKKIMLAGFLAVPIGFFGAFGLAGAMDLLLSLLGVNAESLNTAGIGNNIGIIVMGMVCGAIFGAVLYGRKAIFLFTVVSGAVSFPFGLLVRLFNMNYQLRTKIAITLSFLGPIDLNYLTIITSFGVGIGLSIGLYNMLKNRDYYAEENKF